MLFALFLDSEEIPKTIEIFLHHQTQTLRVQTVTCEVTVVGLVVHAERQITIREDEVA